MLQLPLAVLIHVSLWEYVSLMEWTSKVLENNQIWYPKTSAWQVIQLQYENMFFLLPCVTEMFQWCYKPFAASVRHWIKCQLKAPIPNLDANNSINTSTCTECYMACVCLQSYLLVSDKFPAIVRTPPRTVYKYLLMFSKNHFNSGKKTYKFWWR